jgi:arginase
MGRGPTVLVERFGLPRALARPTDVAWVEAPDPAQPEIARSFAVARALAGHTQAVARAGRVPLVLAGNCNTCLGATAGLGGTLGVIWFDAHADFDTPEDNISGFLDVMGLSALTGGCWRALRRSIPGFREIPEHAVALVGVRDLEPYQRARLDRSNVRAIYADDLAASSIEEALASTLDGLRKVRRDIYLHLDLDVLDLAEGRANEYAAPGGPLLADLVCALRLIGERFNIRGAAITAYDPECDPSGQVGEKAVLMARTIEAACRG